jgi:hypothetical protein
MTLTGHHPSHRARKEQDRCHAPAVEHRCIRRSASAATGRRACHEPSRPASLHRSHPALLKRLDITGARWGLDGAEAILTLRAVISNGDFDEYWRFHLAREHQRLYPGTAQGEYALGA